MQTKLKQAFIIGDKQHQKETFGEIFLAVHERPSWSYFAYWVSSQSQLMQDLGHLACSRHFLHRFGFFFICLGLDGCFKRWRETKNGSKYIVGISPLLYKFERLVVGNIFQYFPRLTV